MRPRDKLFVLWGDVTGTRHVIGLLWREADGRLAFGYRTEDLAEAESAGFLLLSEFTERRDVKDPYRSRYLFSTFAQRIPSPKRPDYRSILATWGVSESDDQLEILAASGGVQITDQIELAEYRDPTDGLKDPLLFRVAGEKHYEGGAHLRVGESVELHREPSNKVDAHATCVLVRSGEKVGYVPRQYSALVARLLDAHRPLQAVAERRLVLPPERDRWIIRVQAA